MTIPPLSSVDLKVTSEVTPAQDTKVMKSELVKIHPPCSLATEDGSEVTHSELNKAEKSKVFELMILFFIQSVLFFKGPAILVTNIDVTILPPSPIASEVDKSVITQEKVADTKVMKCGLVNIPLTSSVAQEVDTTPVKSKFVIKFHMVIKYCSNFYYICSNLLMSLFNLIKFAAIVFLTLFSLSCSNNENCSFTCHCYH